MQEYVGSNSKQDNVTICGLGILEVVVKDESERKKLREVLQLKLCARKQKFLKVFS